MDHMDCCLNEYAEECKILVCVDRPAPHNRTLYSRLRFGLLASSWLPSPLGIFLWSALHVMLLIVGGPVLWVLGLLTAFLFYSVIVFGLLGIVSGSLHVVYGLFAVAIDLVLLLVQSIGFCWSLVGVLACQEPIVEWTVDTYMTVLIWKEFKASTREMFWGLVPFGVPCMSGSVYKTTKDPQLRTWARLCEEVLHMHDAIAL